MSITKSEVKQKLGLKNDAALAVLFQVGKQAVSQWREDGIPIRRQLELQIRFPHLFKAPAPKIRVIRKRRKPNVSK